MTLSEIIAAKVDAYDDVPIAFNSTAEKVNERIYREVLQLMNRMQTEAGAITSSAENYALAEQIRLRMRAVLDGREYQSAVLNFANEFDLQTERSNRYFQKILGEAFDPKSEYIRAVDNSKRRAVQLLLGDSVSDTIFEPLTENLFSSISTNASLSQTQTAVKHFLVDSGQYGKLASYSQQITRDLFSVTDRNYTEAYAVDLGLDWYRYQGGKVADSRAFCVQKNGGWYHKNEVESWGRTTYVDNTKVVADGKPQPVTTSPGNWKGRIPATNSKTIFSYCGGYQCGHALLPTTRESIPDKWIQRSIERGYYMPRAVVN